MNKENLQALAEQVRRLSLALPIQDAEFQAVVDANIGKRNATKRVHATFDKQAEYRTELVEQLERAIAAGSIVDHPMSETRKLAESLRGGLDSRDPLQFKFGSLVELQELADKMEASKPSQAFEIHCRTFKGTHRDKARAWLKLHPKEKKTVEQLKRASERIPHE